MTTPAFTLRARAGSVRYALIGIGFMLRTQHNASLHLAATVAVCTASVLLRISAVDWRWVIVAIVLVWMAEAMNTAFEHLCDVVSPQFHESVKRSKDIAAGAVLICAIGSACFGLSVLLPYLRW